MIHFARLIYNLLSQGIQLAVIAETDTTPLISKVGAT